MFNRIKAIVNLLYSSIFVTVINFSFWLYVTVITNVYTIYSYGSTCYIPAIITLSLGSLYIVAYLLRTKIRDWLYSKDMRYSNYWKHNDIQYDLKFRIHPYFLLWLVLDDTPINDGIWDYVDKYVPKFMTNYPEILKAFYWSVYRNSFVNYTQFFTNRSIKEPITLLGEHSAEYRLDQDEDGSASRMVTGWYFADWKSPSGKLYPELYGVWKLPFGYALKILYGYADGRQFTLGMVRLLKITTETKYS